MEEDFVEPPDELKVEDDDIEVCSWMYQFVSYVAWLQYQIISMKAVKLAVIVRNVKTVFLTKPVIGLRQPVIYR